MNIDTTACPQCSAPAPTLYVDLGFKARPLGEQAVAGMQAKRVAERWPFLRCRSCDLSVPASSVE